MVRICSTDIEELEADGWEIGQRWSAARIGLLTHPEHAPDGIQVQLCPDRGRSLVQLEDGERIYVGPHGETYSISSAFMDLVETDGGCDE